MKGFLLALLFALLAAAGYGYHINPKACRKLGVDLLGNVQAIFAAPSETAWKQGPAPADGSAPAVATSPSTSAQPEDDPEIPAAMRSFDTENYALAVKTAQQRGKKLLLFFTGSDYCPPCQLAVSEIFPTAKFQNWVSSKYIMVTLDYPKFHDQPAELKAQNDSLHQKYHIQGVPTFITTEVDGTEIKRNAGGFVAAYMFPMYFESTRPLVMVPAPH